MIKNINKIGGSFNTPTLLNLTKGIMEISRLIFTKETKEKIDKVISPQLKGKLRWNKLKEAENNGMLQQARNRTEVGRIVGLDNDKTAYSWVSGLINKKAIIETLDGFENNKAIYTYHLGTPLNYENGRHIKKQEQIKNIERELKRQDLVKDNSNVRKNGKIKFNKLKELDKSGELLKATCRADVATLVGYSVKDSKAGYSWVSNMISRGHLNEKMLGITPSGKTLYEYKLTGTQPLYGYEENRNRKSKKVKNQKIWKDENNLTDKQNTIKIKVIKNDIVVELTLENIEQTCTLIKTIYE